MYYFTKMFFNISNRFINIYFLQNKIAYLNPTLKYIKITKTFFFNFINLGAFIKIT